jgi:hypothetical protein
MNLQFVFGEEVGGHNHKKVAKQFIFLFSHWWAKRILNMAEKQPEAETIQNVCNKIAAL